MPPFISIRGLTKRYGEHTVIEDLNLDIEAGEIVVFQGPSGVGKSTFLRCLTYLEPFQEGSFRVGAVGIQAGMDEERDHEQIVALRRQMGYVFQFFNLFPHLTVLQNLTIGPVQVLREPLENAQKRGLELLKRVGLESKAHRYPMSLSGGQQQRVAIARALAMQPQAVLFDEPTSSLDPQMKKEMIQVIEEFRQDHFTMLIVTHEPEVVARIATRVVTFGPHCRIS